MRILPREWGKEKSFSLRLPQAFSIQKLDRSKPFQTGMEPYGFQDHTLFYKVQWRRPPFSLVEMNQAFPICYLGVITWRVINSSVTCADNMKGVTGDLEHTHSSKDDIPSFCLKSSWVLFFSKSSVYESPGSGNLLLLIGCVLCILKFLAYSML